MCSTRNVELVTSLGADDVIDYTREDFTQSATRYDIVYDAMMNSKASRCRHLLNPGGVFTNNFRLPKLELRDLQEIRTLIERDHLRPIVDRTYSVYEIVDAHRYVDSKRKQGNVAVSLDAWEAASQPASDRTRTRIRTSHFRHCRTSDAEKTARIRLENDSQAFELENHCLRSHFAELGR